LQKIFVVKYLDQMKNKLFLMLFFTGLFINITYGFGNESNKTLIKAELTKKIKTINLLNQKSEEILFTNPNQALKYAKSALKLSQEIHYKDGILFSLNNAGFAYSIRGDFNSALDCYNDAMKLSLELHYSIDYASINLNSADVYCRMGNYNKAIQKYYTALKVYTLLNDDYGIAVSRMCIGRVFGVLGNYEKTLDFLEKSLGFFGENGDHPRTLLILYNSYGYALSQMQRYVESIEYYYKALELADNTVDMGSIYNNMGKIYIIQEDYSNAKDMLNKSLEISYSMNDKYSIAHTLWLMSSLYNNTNQYQKAIESAKKTIELSREVGALHIEVPALKILSEALNSSNNYKEALEAHILFKALNDSIFNIEKHKLLTTLEENYQIEGKEKEIKILRQENYIQRLNIEKEKLEKKLGLFFILLLISAAIALGYIFISILKNKHEIDRQKMLFEKKDLQIKAVESEKSALKAQLKPHFIFNALNSIHGQVLLNPKNAASSITKLSSILRHIISESSVEKISLKDELKYITDYIEIQKIRLTDRTKVLFEIEGEPENNVISPLVLVTLIENAFKYGVSTEIETTIDIKITIVGDNFEMNVSNDIVKQKNERRDSLKFGMNSTKKRLDLIYKNKYSLAINDSDNKFDINLKLKLT